MMATDRRVRIPFASKSPEIDYQRISDNSGNSVYLLRIGDVTPSEDTSKLHSLATQRSQVTAIYFKAINAYRDANQCTHEEARAQFFGDNSQDLYDWLSADDITTLIALESSGSEVAIHVATMFIKLRLLYPIILIANAPERSNICQCEPLNFPLSKGDVIRIDRRRIVVAADADYDSEQIEVEPIAASIGVGTVGFLMEGRSERTGDPDWTAEQTEQYLTNAQIEAIYQFYQSESGALQSELSDDTEGNSASTMTPNLMQSSDTPPQTQQTGRKSIGASKATGSATIDSHTRTLEASPVG